MESKRYLSNVYNLPCPWLHERWYYPQKAVSTPFSGLINVGILNIPSGPGEYDFAFKTEIIAPPTPAPMQLIINGFLIAVRDQFIERYGKNAVNKGNSESYLATIELPMNPFAYQFLAGFGNKVKIIKPKAFIAEYLHFFEDTVKLYK
ncbi:hypothetical protein HLK66_22360 [Niallia circulans]|uniref:hypothetical protein n=1 Tax=Niallia circulans TaxID=1397 RepID=UPI0014900A07|nr:hypothetical protein [Niallia circulans]QJX64112.1 hypothetical protein HLK66_22360 [Niallia circulans]